MNEGKKLLEHSHMNDYEIKVLITDLINEWMNNV